MTIVAPEFQLLTATKRATQFFDFDFLRRSAQRFFIISEIRFRPAAVMPPLRFGAVALVWRGALPRAVPIEEIPSRALIA